MVDMLTYGPDQSTCSIVRSLEILGEKWTFLVLREAFSGTTRFADFRAALGLAPDVLSDRLRTLVEAGVLRTEPYREPGSRSRHSYHLTAAGQDLQVVLAALQQWGDRHRPHPAGPTIARRAADDGRPVRVGFVDEKHREVPEVSFEPTEAYPAR